MVRAASINRGTAQALGWGKKQSQDRWMRRAKYTQVQYQEIRTGGGGQNVGLPNPFPKNEIMVLSTSVHSVRCHLRLDNSDVVNRRGPSTCACSALGGVTGRSYRARTFALTLLCACTVMQGGSYSTRLCPLAISRRSIVDQP